MRAALADNHTTSRWPDRLAWLLLLLLAAIALLTFRDYGLGWDDYTHAQYGDLVLSLYTSGFRDTRALTFVNLYLYGGGFDMASAAVAKILPFDLFETRRLIGAAVGLVGLFATWRIARRVGGPVAGLVALALLATCPLYYGHMFINPKDGPFAAMMAIFLLGLVCLIDEKPAVLIADLPKEENEQFKIVKYGLYALKHTYNRGMIFKDFPVPAENLLRVPQGNGLTIAYHGLNLGRVALCPGAPAVTAGPPPVPADLATPGSPIDNDRLVNGTGCIAWRDCGT